MLPYLTPERYRSMGHGTTDQTDEDLLSIINRASLAVDRYCSVPMVPTRYSFRGGAVTDEDHRFRLGDGLSDAPTRTIWPRSKPVKTVTSMRVYVTNAQYVEFSTPELFVTRTNINITSLTLTSVGLFGALAVPVLGLAEPICRVSYTYGYDFDMVDEVLAPTEGTTFRAQNQFWDADAVVVKKNGTIITTGFTVDKVEGTVTMTAQQAESDVITASYGYSLPDEVPQATGLTVAKFIGDRELVAKGMSGVQDLQVGEIRISRPNPRAISSNQSVDLPNEAKQLLSGLHFMTIR
jgi:hypothetical protein